ncbi:Gfo/Idh/MocA family oxidoreductase [Thalassospira sp.]|uniref:Gfo/Idh/MocA family protein n=1 Tax=Thalassospira sp. TaxID=1912094 RepID=UPI001B1A7418|nr:Gfo/Idh/MocA family oxidoreductase [Thalassospira sp.]MBO6805959.1 Gfo/Idh/MocA family oxidoreductase [Thalassospira sp.]
MKEAIRKIGFLGTGAVALDHAACASAMGASIVGGVAQSAQSKSFQLFARRFPEVEYFPDPDSMLNSGKVDAIVMCLPWEVQEKWLNWALECNKPVLIEKPIALSGALLSQHLEKPCVRLDNKVVGYNRRYYETVQQLRDRLGRGGLRAADVTISEDLTSLSRRRGVRCLDYSLENSGCHIIDTAVFLFGALNVRHMTSYSVPFEGQNFQCYNGLLETEKLIPVGFSSNSFDPVKVGIRCKFDDGTFWCLTPTEVLSIYEGYDIVERDGDCEVRRYEPKLRERYVEEAILRPGFGKQMEAFLKREIGPGCTPTEALKTLKLISSIKEQALEIAK